MCNMCEHVDPHTRGEGESCPLSPRVNSGKLRYLDSDKRTACHSCEENSTIPGLVEDNEMETKCSLTTFMGSDAFATTFTVPCACHSPNRWKTDRRAAKQYPDHCWALDPVHATR